jgi:hypothetical protein
MSILLDGKSLCTNFWKGFAQFLGKFLDSTSEKFRFFGFFELNFRYFRQSFEFSFGLREVEIGEN